MKWHPFSEVVVDATSKFSKIKASDYHVQGKYKIIDQGKERIAGYTNDASLINKKLYPILVFGDHTRALKYLDEPIALGADGAKALWVNEELANSKYVYYYLRSIQIKEAGYSRHFKFLKEVEIPIPFKDGKPNLDEQIRIAHLLGKVEALIAQRKQHLQQLDDLLKSVFLEMFGDPSRNERGWTTGWIGQAIKVQGGFAFKSKDIASSGAVKLVKIANVHFENLTWNDASYVPDSFLDVYKKFVLHEDDLLIALTRPVIKSLNVVKTAAVRKEDLPCLLNQRVARFLIDQSRIKKRFFLQFCYTEFFRKTVDGLCPPGLQPNISTNQIEEIPIFYPPVALQNDFEAIANKVEGIKFDYQSSLTKLEAIYGSLSQQAFKGELDLSRVELANANT